VEVAISAWGWASAPHPQQAWSQIPSWLNIPQKVASSRLCPV
jgi:hypothetical protein